MKNKSILFAVIVTIHYIAFSQPTDNPVATYYNGDEGYPAWTDKINWNNVIDMSTYSTGANDFEKFENAGDQLYGMGGGVLYYPAGTYDFSDIPQGPNGRGLLLKNGVVIRGEAPSTDKEAIKASFIRYNESAEMPSASIREDHGLKALGTVFQFPFVDVSSEITIVEYDKDGHAEVPDMWNFVGLQPGAGEGVRDVDYVGICWVHMVGGGIFFGPDRAAFDSPKTYENGGGWLSKNIYCDGSGTDLWTDENWKNRTYDGTHPFDPWTCDYSDYRRGAKGRLIMGCWFDNVTTNASIMDKCNKYPAYGPRLHQGRFVSRITVYGSEVFVANNVLSKPTKCFMFQNDIYTDNKAYTVLETKTLMFDYANCLGIDVNKQVAASTNEDDIANSYLYEEGVIVRDNYVFQTGNKPYELGCKWGVFQNNIAYHPKQYMEGDQIYDYLSTLTWTFDYGGCRRVCCQDDMMARGFDVGGQYVWMDNNWWDATSTGPRTLTNDGEGILIQRNNHEVNCFGWAFTNNAEGHRGNQGGVVLYDVHGVGVMMAWNTINQDIQGLSSGVGAEKIQSNYTADFSVVQNYLEDGTELTSAECATKWMNCDDGEINVQDYMKDCPTGTPTPPLNITATPEPLNNRILVEWTADESDHNEIGFRIDRSTNSGPWTTISYRPRHEWTGTFNFNGYTGDLNEQAWADYTAPYGKSFKYRVVSIKCNDDDSQAIEIPTDVVLGVKPVTSTEEVSFTVYPSPAQNTITVKGINAANYELFNIAGNLVKKGSANSGNTLSVEELPSGVYILKINGISAKIMKQ
jgi:hypothetical protein